MPKSRRRKHVHRAPHSHGQARPMTRTHKNLLHLLIVATIAVSLWLEGGNRSDWLFLGLAGMVEVS